MRHPALFLAILALAAAPAAADLSPRDIYRKDAPAVVLLLCTGADGTGELGSGSLIDANGHILTNAHVVLKASTGEPYDNLHVYFKPAKLTGDPKVDLVNPRSARVVKSDRAMDLALLELDEKPEHASVMPIGDSDAAQSGDPVVAIGHPEQGGLWTLTTGVISTQLADLGGVKGKNVFQTDASINRGNSGGPLIDRSGSLIGVNTSMARKAADGLTITGENFSLKASVVKGWLAGTSVALVAQAETAPAPAAQAPKAQAPAPAPAPEVEEAPKPAQTPKPAEPPKVEEAPKPEPPKVVEAPKPAPKPEIVTPKRPYVISQLMKDMAEMEDLESEMRQEIELRRQRGQ